MPPRRGVSGSLIVFLNNYAGPGMGGGEVHLQRLVRACIAADMSVHVVCEPGSALGVEAAKLGAAVVPYRLGRRNVVGTVAHVRKYLRRHGAAIVHSGGFLTNVIARLAAWSLPTAVVNTYHCQIDASLADGGSRFSLALRSFVDRVTWRHADLVLPVADAIASQLARHGLPRERMEVIRTGIDVEQVHRCAETASVEGLPVGAGPVVGVIARLEPVKGVEGFVRMMATVARTHPDARFVVVGAGSEAESLRALAVELGVGERVKFLGEVSPAYGVLSRLDVCVVPSLSEGIPVVMLEAMALGVSIVASRVGGIPEAVADHESGLLVEPGDPDALAAAVGALLDDPTLRRTMSIAARRRVTDSFSAEAMDEAYVAVYERLVKHRV